ncbi:hypothetical protein F4677DRAFT_439748 [Hypoxylon crocopeplum]|nr:hypothetical protein F4677DRAFT_439748 [Hypoxylon crocopeplum]
MPAQPIRSTTFRPLIVINSTEILYRNPLLSHRGFQMAISIKTCLTALSAAMLLASPVVFAAPVEVASTESFGAKPVSDWKRDETIEALPVSDWKRKEPNGKLPVSDWKRDESVDAIPVSDW